MTKELSLYSGCGFELGCEILGLLQAVTYKYQKQRMLMLMLMMMMLMLMMMMMGDDGW